MSQTPETTETPTPTGPLAAARRALAERATARAERPAAVCAVCGGIVPAGRGEVDGTPDADDAKLDAKRAASVLPPLHGWTRRHTACDDPRVVVRALTGRNVTEEVARRALAAARARRAVGAVAPDAVLLTVGVDAADLDQRVLTSELDGTAWAHVDREQRGRLADAVDELRRQLRLTKPHRCTSGPCGFCGVARSTSWHSSPLKWRDGSAAPLCADCQAVARRRPRSSDTRDLRALAIEALSGASGMGMAETFGERMRMFSELVAPGHDGTEAPWTYAADAWGEIREDARRALPTTLPEPLRSHYVALRRAEREAAMARAAHEAPVRERAELAAAGWPIE